MLAYFLPKLKSNKFLQILNKIFVSPYYIAFVAILVCLAEIFSFEFVAYYILIALSIVVPSLLLDDMSATIPATIMMHIAMSKKTFDNENTVLFGKNLPHFFIMFFIISVCLIGRLVIDLIKNKDRRKHYPRFTIGYVALLLAFVFGGAFSKYFDIKTVGFGFMEIAAIGGLYFYFIYTIDWKKYPKDNFAWIFLFFGLAISTEIIVLVAQNYQEITTGWGVRTNIGGTLAMTVGGAGYLTIKKKAYINWLFPICMLFILTCAGLTESRGGFISTLVIVIVCYILIMVFTNWVSRLTASIILVIFFTTFLLLYIFQNSFMMDKFGRILDLRIDDLDSYSSGRITIWKTGIKQWLENPAFGVGWLQTEWTHSKFPAAYHNTFVQLLASTGLIGLIAYIFHRFETIFVVFKKPNLEKVYAFICVMGLMVGSLLDCQFWQVWLGFGYSFLLAFIEGQDIRNDISQSILKIKNKN